jgi:4-methylaminobutanoate oxidase (formaldehyde-forming)
MITPISASSDGGKNPMKCIVIGGGVIGTSIAWHLARQTQAEVTLLERDRLGAGTTWHSAGNITWKPTPSYDAPVQYAFETLAHLKEAGHETGWLTTGRTFLARTAETRHQLEQFDSVARERGIAARWLDPAEARALNPLLDPATVEHGIWLNPLSGRANPADLTAAYASAARRAGARITENVDVLALATTVGRVTGVETNAGIFPADIVIVAAGLWSRDLLTPLGISLAQWPCEHFYLLAQVSPRLPRETPSFVAPDDLIYGREEVEKFLVGCFDENAKTFDPATLPKPFSFSLLPPDWDKIAPYFARMMRLFPALETAPIQHFVNGPETFTPDGVPLIGRVPEIEGLLVATAMNSHGVTSSAMAGSLIADIVAGKQQKFDASHHDPVRFNNKGADLDWLQSKVSAIVSQGYRDQHR